MNKMTKTNTTTKTKQVQKRISLETALKIIDEEVGGYLKSGVNPLWGVSVAEVIATLFDATDKDTMTIEYNVASRILDEARTSKLTPSCNAGMAKIKERWKQNYL